MVRILDNTPERLQAPLAAIRESFVYVCNMDDCTVHVALRVNSVTCSEVVVSNLDHNGIRSRHRIKDQSVLLRVSSIKLRRQGKITKKQVRKPRICTKKQVGSLMPVKNCLANKMLRSITQRDVQKFYNALGRKTYKASDGSERSLADATVRGVHMLLHEIMEAAARWRWAIRKPKKERARSCCQQARSTC